MTKGNKPKATPEEILENDRREWTRNIGGIQTQYLARIHDVMHHREHQAEY